jgi:hypothetical protein
VFRASIGPDAPFAKKAPIPSPASAERPARSRNPNIAFEMRDVAARGETRRAACGQDAL